MSPSSLAVEFFVEGPVVPQGSKVIREVPGKRPFLVDANSNELKKWRRKVAAAAQLNHWSTQIQGAVMIVADFVFERPKTVKREFPSVRPDGDKCLRSLFDGITDSGVWKDDALVVGIYSTQTYGSPAGALVKVYELEGNH